MSKSTAQAPELSFQLADQDLDKFYANGFPDRDGFIGGNPRELSEMAVGKLSQYVSDLKQEYITRGRFILDERDSQVLDATVVMREFAVFDVNADVNQRVGQFYELLATPEFTHLVMPVGSRVGGRAGVVEPEVILWGSTGKDIKNAEANVDIGQFFTTRGKDSVRDVLLTYFETTPVGPTILAVPLDITGEKWRFSIVDEKGEEIPADSMVPVRLTPAAVELNEFDNAEKVSTKNRTLLRITDLQNNTAIDIEPVILLEGSHWKKDAQTSSGITHYSDFHDSAKSNAVVNCAFRIRKVEPNKAGTTS